MLVSKTAKLEKVCSKDQTRPVLCNAYVHVDETGAATLQATNSYALVRVPVTLEDGDTPGFVPASVLTEARKGTDRYTSDVTISANGDLSYTTKDGGTVTVPRVDVGQFPNAAQLYPEELSSFAIGVNPRLLLDAAEAMGAADGIVLQFARTRDSSIECDSDPLRPITVKPLTQSGGVAGADAIVMPIKVGQ